MSLFVQGLQFPAFYLISAVNRVGGDKLSLTSIVIA